MLSVITVVYPAVCPSRLLNTRVCRHGLTAFFCFGFRIQSQKKPVKPCRHTWPWLPLVIGNTHVNVSVSYRKACYLLILFPRLLNTHDAVMALIPLVEQPPWVRERHGGKVREQHWYLLQGEPYDMVKYSWWTLCSLHEGIKKQNVTCTDTARSSLRSISGRLGVVCVVHWCFCCCHYRLKSSLRVAGRMCHPLTDWWSLNWMDRWQQMGHQGVIEHDSLLHQGGICLRQSPLGRASTYLSCISNKSVSLWNGCWEVAVPLWDRLLLFKLSRHTSKGQAYILALSFWY